MNTIRHQLSIQVEQHHDYIYLSLKVVGKLTHEDYETITPMLDNALEGVNDAKINAFVDASELTGWELRAAWDDFKLGLKHGKEFQKIAMFGHEKWHDYLTKIASWFMSGEVKYFYNQEDALSWLNNASD
jgi:hypothetical protein